jgi:hypothetical protein
MSGSSIEPVEILSVRLDEHELSVRIKWHRSGTAWTLNEPADSVLAGYVRGATANAIEDHFKYLADVRVSAEEPPSSQGKKG